MILGYTNIWTLLQQKIVPITNSIEKDPSLLIMTNEIYSPL